MPVSGIPVVDSTVQHVTAKDIRDTDIAQHVEQFTKCLNNSLDEMNFLLEDQQCPPDVYINYDDNKDHRNENNTDHPEADDIND